VADLADVLNGIREEVTAALNAEGIVQPGVSSKGLRIYRGWPGEALDADLLNGIAHVTIYPRAGVASVLPGSIDGWVENARPTLNMSAAAEEDTATFTGTANRTDMVAAVVADGAGWTLALTNGQTAESVAATFATAIAEDRPASATGPALTLSGAARLRVGVYSWGTERLEVRRQEQGVLVTVWAPSPALRDRIAGVLDLHFASERGRLSREMADGTEATIRYAGTVFDDAGREHPVYRRDLAVLVEYSTVRTRSQPPVAAGALTVKSIPPVIERTINV
jgi:hypothetical protein